jgi:hypothetical protein
VVVIRILSIMYIECFSISVFVSANEFLRFRVPPLLPAVHRRLGSEKSGFLSISLKELLTRKSDNDLVKSASHNDPTIDLMITFTERKVSKH